MIREFGLWAGEVGNLVAMGMGDMLDSHSNLNVGKRGRRSISGDAPEEEGGQEDKLGFADIVCPPSPSPSCPLLSYTVTFLLIRRVLTG